MVSLIPVETVEAVEAEPRRQQQHKRQQHARVLRIVERGHQPIYPRTEATDFRRGGGAFIDRDLAHAILLDQGSAGIRAVLGASVIGLLSWLQENLRPEPPLRRR